MTKKKSSEFLADKKELFREKSIFFQTVSLVYRNLTLGFLRFFYWPILTFLFFQSGNAALPCTLRHHQVLLNKLNNVE